MEDKQKKKIPMLQKMAMMGALGGLSPVIAQSITGADIPPGKMLGHMGSGALMGAGSTGLGQAIYGDSPDDGSFGTEFKKGATGGAILGAGKGIYDMGTMRGGKNLINFLKMKGLSSKGALLAALGGGALLGSGENALVGGLNQGIMFGRQKK